MACRALLASYADAVVDEFDDYILAVHRPRIAFCSPAPCHEYSHEENGALAEAASHVGKQRVSRRLPRQWECMVLFVKISLRRQDARRSRARNADDARHYTSGRTEYQLALAKLHHTYDAIMPASRAVRSYCYDFQYWLLCRSKPSFAAGAE